MSAMHAARIDHSPRLKRTVAFLADGREYSTLEIIAGAGVCAVSAVVAELRANGLDITCRRDRGLWFYRLNQGAPA